MITPKSLRPGDTIAIVSPASVVNPDYIAGAADFMQAEGFQPMVMSHAAGPAEGSFAASANERAADLCDALRDPSIRAILCARGGYGCNHLLAMISPELVADNPKWLIGFSDISALHALWQRAGLVSLHAPMAKHLASLPADHYCTRSLMRVLTDGLPVEYIIPAHPFNHAGEAEGMIVGGNLAVINGLAATSFDPLRDANVTRKILFIEDIAEKIYAVERMLMRMALAGQLKHLAGIIVGHFTEYLPDRNHPDMETMISRLFRSLEGSGLEPTCPVAFGFPAGHTDDNLPIPLGAHASLSVTKDGAVLTLANPF